MSNRQTRGISHYHCFCREPFPLLSPHFLEVRVGSVWPPSRSFQPHRGIRMYTLFEWYLHVNNLLTRRKSRYNRWLAYWPIERWKWENDDLSEKIRLCLLTSGKNGRAGDRTNILCESNLRIIVSMNVFWGAETWPRFIGMMDNRSSPVDRDHLQERITA